MYHGCIYSKVDTYFSALKYWLLVVDTLLHWTKIMITFSLLFWYHLLQFQFLKKKKKSYSEFKIILTYKALWPRLNDSLQPYTVRKLLKRVCGIKALSNPTAKANVPTKDGEKCIADSLYTIMQYIGSYQCCCCDTSNQHQEDTR